MSQKEIEEYDETKGTYYKYDNKQKNRYWDDPHEDFLCIEGYYLARFDSRRTAMEGIIKNFPCFSLRNNLQEGEIKEKLEKLKINIWKSSMSFKISDNLGNSSVPVCIQIVSPNWGCFYDFDSGCDWPIWINCNEEGEKRLTIYDVYGITSSKDSYDKAFMGGSQSEFNGSNEFCVYKTMYFSENEYNSDVNTEHWLVKNWQEENCESKKKGITYYWRWNKIHFEDGSFKGSTNLIFSNQYYYSCLDLSGKSFPYSIYLYYNEKDLEKLSSITISPVSPSEFIFKQIKLDKE